MKKEEHSTEMFCEELEEQGKLDIRNYALKTKDRILEYLSWHFDEDMEQYLNRCTGEQRYDRKLRAMLKKLYPALDDKTVYVKVKTYLDKNFKEISEIRFNKFASDGADIFSMIDLGSPTATAFISVEYQKELDMGFVREHYTDCGQLRLPDGTLGNVFSKVYKDAFVDLKIPLWDMANIFREVDPHLYKRAFDQYLEEAETESLVRVEEEVQVGSSKGLDPVTIYLFGKYDPDKDKSGDSFEKEYRAKKLNLVDEIEKGNNHGMFTVLWDWNEDRTRAKFTNCYWIME